MRAPSTSSKGSKATEGSKSPARGFLRRAANHGGMRKLTVIALASVLVLALAPVGRTDTAAPAVVRVHVTSDAEAAYLMSNFDETHNHSHGEIELLLWPG